MESLRDSESTGDLSPLAWVQEELRRAMEAALKGVRRFAREAQAMQGDDTNAVDPSVLNGARHQLHQAAGALRMVGEPAGAAMALAAEAAVQRVISRPRSPSAGLAQALEKASFALMEYLARRLSGKPVSPVLMFPQYRALQSAAGVELSHPADLWHVSWAWRDLPAEEGVTPRQVDAESRGTLESDLLASMRGRRDPAESAATLSELFAGLGAGAADAHDATLWRLAAGFYDAQAYGLLATDNYTKRVGARLLAHLRAVEQQREPGDVDRLARDLMFHCAQAASPGDGRQAPRLASVRQVFELTRHDAVDYEVSRLGRFDPAWLAQARKRVSAAKDSWSAVAGGDLPRLQGLVEQFSLVGESLGRLFPNGEPLGQALSRAASHTVARASAPPPALAMEVATSVLFVEASLEDGDLDHPELGDRVTRLAQRIDAADGQETGEPLEPWMEELYRRVSDRQTMGSVVQELRVSLGEAERQIDQYFRNPAEREALIPVPGQLAAMRGVLSVLGLGQACAAVQHMRSEVDALVSTELDPERARYNAMFERLAGNLGALGFLIDMLGVQPTLAKSLFSFDAATGIFAPVMGRTTAPTWTGSALPGVVMPPEPRLVEQAQALAVQASRDDLPAEDLVRELDLMAQSAEVAEQPQLASTVAHAQVALEMAASEDEAQAVREQLVHSIQDFVASTSDPVDLAPDVLPATPAMPVTMSDEDEEMLEIFLEEAREVIDGARAALGQLQSRADDIAQLTTVRRAFHTLKGSSRMVGLVDFGEAAWSCEQLYNSRLADSSRADEPMLGFSGEALDYLAAWVDEIAARVIPTHATEPVRQAADALRLRGERMPIAAGASEEAVEFAEPVQAMPEPVADAVVGVEAASDVAFSFDLPDLGSGAVEERPSFELDTQPLDLETADLAVPVPADVDLPLLSLEGLDEAPVLETLEPAEGKLALDLPVPGPSGFGAPEAFAMDADGWPDFATRTLDGVLDETATEAVAPTFDADTALPLDGEAPTSVWDAEGPLDIELAALSSDEESTEADDEVKLIGDLRIPIPLFNIYLNEADELSRRLVAELGEWSHQVHQPVSETAVALAHSLAGSSATVGYVELSGLARALEHSLVRSHALGAGQPEDVVLFSEVAEDIRRLLHQFAAGFLKSPAPSLLERLAQFQLQTADRMPALGDDAAHDAEDLSLAAAVAESTVVPLAEMADESPMAAPVFEGVLPEIIVPAPDMPVVEAVEPSLPAIETLETSEAPLSANAGVEAASYDTAMPVAASLPSLSSLGQASLKSLHDLPAPTSMAPLRDGDIDDDENIDAVDMVDAELFPLFEDEALELLPQLASRLADWAAAPRDASGATACMRTLHTLKGGARLAGAMRLGELAHRLETTVEHLGARADLASADVEALHARADALVAAFESLRRQLNEGESADVAASLPPSRPMPASPAASGATVGAAREITGRTASVVSDVPIDWSRFSATAVPVPLEKSTASAASMSGSTVRVRTPLLDRLVNHAGEVSITRSRIELEMAHLRSSLTDLTDNLDRLRGQLRDIELQAETQMASRMEAAKAASESFDPLEFDRFTRFQELTRMMAESVNDVATVQRTLQRTLEATEDDLAAQSRLTRELHEGLLRTRMVEFESIADRLYRVVRQAAKETGKQVRLDILGGSIEVDRGVLDRMTGSFEHLLRNCVTHGIEMPDARVAAGKEAAGSIVVALTQEGNEVGVEFRDDGQGLDLQRIQSRGVELGLIDGSVPHADAELVNLIFAPGFSTAAQVTELAGRGIGMDVVRSEVNAMGGRIETATERGRGSSFRLVMPLTTAVTQVVMMRCGESKFGVPATLVELVRREPRDKLAACYASGAYEHDGQILPYFYLGGLLGLGARSQEVAKHQPVLMIRSAQQRVAVHVDEVMGSQEVVVKNLGPQLSRLPGLAGMTLLADGSPTLIYNPVALATLYGAQARVAVEAAAQLPQALDSVGQADAPVVIESTHERLAPLVLVVDDSLTVRRVTQRLLTREGYRVSLAKDGLEALERLAAEKPDVVLSDIEMPRMDGFDLVRNLRGDSRWRELPVIMITSRIAQKHREHAAQLGVDHYLGKPYNEEDLLALIRQYTTVEAVLL